MEPTFRRSNFPLAADDSLVLFKFYLSKVFRLMFHVNPLPSNALTVDEFTEQRELFASIRRKLPILIYGLIRSVPVQIKPASICGYTIPT